MTTPMIAELVNISKHVTGSPWTRPVPIIKDVSFAVRAGEVVGFVGHNGAGKSTTMRIMCGLCEPSAGVVRLFGLKPSLASARRKLGFSPDSPRIPDTLTPRELVHLHQSVSGIADGELALERVGLAAVADRLVRGFSKGMRQRLSLALAIMGKPDFLILDEPMSGLDPVGRADVRHIIQEEASRGATLLFSSHVLADVDDLCDRVVVMRQGAVALDHPIKGSAAATGWRISFVDGTAPVEVAGDTAPYDRASQFEAHGKRVAAVARSRPDLETLILPLLSIDDGEPS